MPPAVNLYAPPKAQVEDVVPFRGEAYEIRREHIKTEASVRSIGSLYYLGGTLLCILAVAVLVGNSAVSRNLAGKLPGGVFAAIYLACGVLSIFVARGLRQLSPWARTAALVLSFIGLVSMFTAHARFPVGGFINAYVLYLLFSKKGKRIFESDYAEIIAVTPDVKSRTSAVTWFLLAVLVLLLLVVFVSAALLHK